MSRVICDNCPCLLDWTPEGFEATCGLGYKVMEFGFGKDFRSDNCGLIVIETKGGSIYPKEDEND